MAIGYSGTALARKLGVEDGQRTWRYRMPETIAQEIAEFGENPKILKSLAAGLEMVHLFVVERKDLTRLLHSVRPLLDPAGMIWVSWPKKAAKVPTDISEHEIRTEAFPLGLVDIKVCAVDATWSGLKLVIRKTARAKKAERSLTV